MLNRGGMMNSPLKIGLIGLDTSHVEHFTRLINDPTCPHHVAGARVELAYPGGSSDWDLSWQRVPDYTAKLRDRYGVKIVDSIAEVAQGVDLIFLESVDGRVHLEQFSQIAPFEKPVFIDKPFTLSKEEAVQIWQLAEKYQVPVLSSSALRFAQPLTDTLENFGDPLGADCFGPLDFQPTQPGWFWYGIHLVEMLYTIMGPGCKSVLATIRDDCELVLAKWSDGRVCTIRGNLRGNYDYGALLHYSRETAVVEVKNSEKPFYASLVEQILLGFQGKAPWPSPAETLEIIRFVEAVNKSRASGDGKWVHFD